ncbi:hypothetical protein [Pararhizobium gei]|uniref:hypothetical protein n=1 Tax=Pararhizobium gei TaxID=1395951 RepID=UPI0023DB5CDF|nr:hypothetical protein [Rhizobium gei]
MSQASPENLEGRLNGHRKLFVALAAFIARTDEGRTFLDTLARDSEMVSDHEEDPGVMPNEGFAMQQIADDEMRSIVFAALSRANAIEGQQQKTIIS